MKAKQSIEENILSPTARTLIKQAKQEERERMIKSLNDILDAHLWADNNLNEHELMTIYRDIRKLINQESNA